MKQLFLFLISTVSLAACAQLKGSGKLYAYQQPVITGMVDRQIEVNGTETTRTPRERTNYYIYLVSSSRAYPAELWIKGQQYAASVRSIKETPVTIKNVNIPRESDEIQLVPKTGKQVIQLTAVPATGSKTSAKGKRLAGTNELVVVYKQNGKMYYQVLREFSSLQAAAMY